MRTLILPMLLVVAAGCGGGPKTYSITSYSLTVADEGYLTSTGTDFCSTAGAPGQMMLDFVDYDFLCDPKHPPARDKNQAHVEMRIILNIGLPPTYDGNFPGTRNSKPYDVSPGDCTTGIGSNQAQFLHYGPGDVDPDTTVDADSGTVSISQFDANKVKPLMGEFDLHFGSKEVKDTFKLFSCN